MKSSDLFVKALENEGIKYIFGIPGEENLDMLESLRQSGIEVIVTRHEQAAGFMAATVGRMTGKVGACISTLGPGATNFTTSSAYALLGGFPMMMITGQKPIRKSKQGQFQIVDVVGMMKPITKFTTQITDGATIPKLIRDAVASAESERPGPVHFEFPEDVARDLVDGGEVMTVEPPEMRDANIEDLAKAVDMILKAKSPLFLIAAGGNRRADVSEACRKFVDETGMYFIDSQMGKGVVDERHPLYLGTTALSANDFMHCAVAKADLVIVIGHDSMEKPPFIMPEEGGPQVIHVNHYSVTDDFVYHPHIQVVGNLAHSVNYLAESLKGQEWDFSYYKTLKGHVDHRIGEWESDHRFPLVPGNVVSTTRKLMPSDGVVCLDNGMYKLWFARHYLAHQPNTLLLDNALASMGAGLPSAMAVKILYPERKVIAVCGDGGFMMNSQELETAVRMKMDLVVLILNDNGYGMIKWKQQDMGFEDYALDFANPDFVKYAESYGAHGHRVAKFGDFEMLLDRCLKEKGVHVIEVPVDYSVNSQLSGPALKEHLCPM